MRIAIAGAGNVGRAIARELLENGHQVLLIDKDPKALKMDSVPSAEWLLADACEITALDQAKLDNCQVLVAATGDDKVNLVASLLGKTEYGVPRVVARVNHPKNEWMFDSAWGVDVAVSNLIKWPILGLTLGPILGENLMWRKDPDRLNAYIKAGWLWVGRGGGKCW